MRMQTFTELLLMHLPIPASQLLLGVDSTNDPHYKKESLRKVNRLSGIFERELKLRSQLIWHVRRFPILLSSY